MYYKFLVFPLLGLISLTALIPPALHRAHGASLPVSAKAGPCTFTFVQAGDPQIGGRSGLENTKGRFLEFVRQMNELKPDFVVICGDLVNDQTDPAEWAAFEEGLHQLQVPAKLVCGNHDDLATFRRKFGPDYYSFTHDNCEFIILNSNFMNALGGSWKIQADQQWQWLESTLARVRAEGRDHIFIAQHHPPQLLFLPWSRLRLEHLMQQYNAEFLLTGHSHMTHEFRFSQYTTYTVAGTGWCQDGKGFGYRLFNVWPHDCHQEYVHLEEHAKAAKN